MSTDPRRGQPERLWAALADGTLDLVVSDHSPCAPHQKAGGDFGRAFGGVSSLQLGPCATWTQAAARGFDHDHKQAPGFTLDTLTSIRWKQDHVAVFGPLAQP